MDFQIEEGIARAQPPPVGGLVVDRQFHAIRFAVGLVGHLRGRSQRRAGQARIRRDAERLRGAQVIIQIVKRRHVHRDAPMRLHPPAHLEGSQFLRAEIRIAQHGEERRRPGLQTAEDDIVLGPRRRAHRPRHPAPQRVLFARRPQQAPAGLILHSGVLRPLELRSEDEPQPVRHQRQIVLHERAQGMRRAAERVEPGEIAVAKLVMRQAVAGSPDNFVALGQGEAVLKIQIERVARLIDVGRLAARHVVKRLHGQF